MFTIVQPSDRDKSQLCLSQIAVSVALFQQSLSPHPPLVARPHPDDEAGHDVIIPSNFLCVSLYSWMESRLPSKSETPDFVFVVYKCTKISK